MSIIIDLVVVAIIILSIFTGYKKGLTKCLIKILSFVVAIVIAALFFRPVGDFIIARTEIDDNIKASIINLVKDDVQETGKIKEDSNLPKTMVDNINESISKAVDDTKMTVVENAASGIATTTVHIGVAILLFIIVRIVLGVVSLVSEALTNLPVIKQFDKAGGAIYGLLRGCIVIYVILAIISLISPMIQDTQFVSAINSSLITGMLYNNNLLIKFLF